MDNRPRGREKNITGAGKDVKRRGSGLGTGPVGNAGGYQGRRGSESSGYQRGASSDSTTRSKGSPLIIIIILAMLLFGGGGALFGGLFGGSDSGSGGSIGSSIIGGTTYDNSQQSSQSSYSSGSLSSLLGGLTSSVNSGSTSSGWSRTANTGVLNTNVVPGTAEKRTEILGGGRDVVTIMVYMCGTDLESRSAMATYDLQEMMAVDYPDNLNVIVYTGGCKNWRNNVVSSSVNQIYKVEKDNLIPLEKNMGTSPMTSPANLTAFIKWCAKEYPANRNELIFWDHGGGSLSGYGYDEKNASAGSMSLKGINQALSDAGVKFDFIGFDACLMATMENALMLSSYGDYLIASEETEPGIGWYYTNWLTKLSADTSMPTLQIGKNIVDDFVDTCASKCRGQKATLSVVDLAELKYAAPEELGKFAEATTTLLKNDEYQTVSDARSNAREFASSSRIDQIDLIHFAGNVGTEEGESLAKTLLSAVKYNRTSSDMTDAYGLSIYFPYRKVSSVDNAVATYDAIGMDDEYARCIQQFASIETSGQAVSGGASSPLSALMGGYSSSGTTASSSDMITQMLTGLLGGSFNGVSGLTGSNSGFLGKSLDVESTAEYVANNRFDSQQLVWSRGNSGEYEISLSEEQWGLVHELELNVFFDDGEGYIDLGLDNVFEFSDDGALLGTYDGTWLAINDQPVAYYHVDTYDDGDNYTITGRVPVMLNDERADLILVFDNDHPYGYIAGARTDYRNGETETIAKSMTEICDGDTIDFLCDYYGYDGTYMDSYYLGDALVVDGELTISNVYINADAACATYRFVDIYQQEYWTPVIP